MSEQPQSFKINHPDFDYFFNKLAWGAILAVVSFASYQLNKLSDNVADLNKSMSVIIYQMQSVEKRNDELKAEVVKLADRVSKLEKIL